MASTSASATPNAISKIVFVGGGINSLATAIALLRSKSKKYDIEIFEKRPQDAASAAAVSGLHLKPNATRLLHAWDVAEFFERGRVMNSTKICRYANGKLLGSNTRPVNPQNEVESRTQQTWYINRADIWVVLYEKAIALGTKVHFESNVESIDADNSQLHLDNGKKVDYDLLIGSDGLHSHICSTLFPDSKYRAEPSGHVVYQISVPESTIYALPESEASKKLREIYEDQSFRVYIGPDIFIVGATSTRRHKLELQICAIDHEDPTSEGRWTSRIEDMQPIVTLVEHFTPEVRLAFSSTDFAWKWRLGETPDLPRWWTAEGKIMLLGDSAHASLPFSGLGAGLGLEDGAVLAELLDHANTTSSLSRVAQTYETMRRPRVDRCRAVSRLNGPLMALADGEKQEYRDRILGMPPMQRPVDDDVARGVGSGAFHGWLNGFDVVKEAREAAMKWDQES